MWLNRFAAAAIWGLVLGGSAAGVFAQTATLADCDDQRVLIGTPAGIVDVAVELADTPELRANGLMHRQDLPKGQGMLFIYETPQTVSFWMRNTLIPLDMIFLDKAGVIRHIHRNARPLDETSIPGAVPGDPAPNRLMVLEIGGGETDRLGLKPGQVMAHPALDAAHAAWPCG